MPHLIPPSQSSSMPTRLPIAAIFGAAVAMTSNAFAGQALDAAPSKQGPPLVPENPLSFADGRLVFDGEERARFEWRDNNFDFNRGLHSPTDGEWLLQRFRIGATLNLSDSLTFYFQGQDSLEVGSARKHIPGSLGAEGDDVFDLRQAWVRFGNTKSGLSLTLGRQILSYGDERLVGAFDWNNLGRVFDAAKVHVEEDGWWLDAFSSSVVTWSRNQFGKSDLFNGNENHRDLIFSGVYFEDHACPFVTFDLYAFLMDRAAGNDANQEGVLSQSPAGGSPAQGGDYSKRSDFVTLGTRVVGDPKKLGGFEYNGEFAFQVGQVAGLDLRAGAAHAGAGYNFYNLWSQPRLWAEFNYASGDGDRTDHYDHTFQNLFPTNHKFYGYMDLFAWQNMEQPALSLRVKPLAKVTFEITGRSTFATTTADSWYRANGLVRVRPLSAAANRAGNYEGTELDLAATYSPCRYFSVQLGYSHFWAGDYLKATGAHSDADFAYTMATITF